MSAKKNYEEALILALASGLPIKDAASKAGVCEKTAYRRYADPEFRTRIDAMRSQMVQDAIGRLASIGGDAGDRIKKLIKGGKGIGPSVQLGACRAAFEFMFRGHEQDVLARQYAEMRRELDDLIKSSERSQEGGSGGPGNSAPTPRIFPANESAS